MSLSIDITDRVSPVLKQLQARLSPDALRAPVGAALVKLFQDNFITLPQNSRGYPTTNFWPRAAKSTNFAELTDGVNINVSQQGVRQRLIGGEIHPTGGKKYLTIPNTPETYGHRAGEFQNLSILWRWSGGSPKAVGLVAQRAVATLIKRSTRGKKAYKAVAEQVGQVVMFWLVKSVTQPPNPNVIPSEDQIGRTVLATLNGIAGRLGGVA